MAISVIQSLGNENAGSTGGSVVMTSNAVIGQPIVVTVPYTIPGNITSITDNVGNTYTEIGSSTPGFNGTSLWWAIAQSTSPPTVTIAMNGTRAWKMQVVMLQGFVGTPTVDAAMTKNFASLSGTNVNFNPIGTLHNNEVLFMVATSPVDITQSSGPTGWISTGFTSPGTFSGDAFYAIENISGTPNNFVATLPSSNAFYGQLFGIYDNPGTYQFVRQIGGGTASPVNALAATLINVVAGDALVIAVLKKTTDTVTISDAGQGNTYVHVGTTPVLGGNAIFVDFFYALNVAAGNTVITATEATNSDICATLIQEFSGIATSGSILGSSFNNHAAPGSGVNAYSANSISYSLGASPGAMVWGLMFDQPGTANGTCGAGSGFTGRVNTWSNPAGLGGTGSTGFPEDKRVTASGSITATFFIGAANASDNFYAGVFILPEPPTAIPLTGQTITSSVGAVGLTNSDTFSAQTITSAAGALTGAVTIGLGAQTVTFIEGLISTQFTFTPQTITSSVGVITASISGNVTLALGAQTAQFAQGVLFDNVSYILDTNTVNIIGQTATFAMGVIVPEVDIATPAFTGTFTEGTATSEVDLSLAAQSIAMLEGAITASTGNNINKTLSAQNISTSEGVLSAVASATFPAYTVALTEGLISFSATNDQTFTLTGQFVHFTEGQISALVPGGEWVAREALMNAGLVPIVQYDEDPVVQPGFVISQQPASGTTVKVNSPVVMVVSRGPHSPQGQVMMPNLIGLYWKDATDAMAQAYVSQDKYIWAVSPQPQGQVIAQSVVAGAAVPAGTLVQLTLSAGPAKVPATVAVPLIH